MNVPASLKNYCWFNYGVLPLWILVTMIFLHRELRHFDGLFGALTYPGIGENGSGSYLDAPYLDIDEYEEGWIRYSYNSWLAARIPVRRSLPDYRDPLCLNITYDEDFINMNPASIILIFRNEQLVVLLRTLHSLVSRTPKHLISELILVDDHSDAGFWKEKISVLLFDTYVRKYIYPKARIYHFENHMGLIRARAWAASQTMPVNLVFVDAQVEFTEGWLPPLLNTISEEIQTLATPILDEINEDNFGYLRSNETRGIYDWSLRRLEVPLSEEKRLMLPKPYEVAAVRTSVFAIPSVYFQELSYFDEELSGFGGAELELSFKVWRNAGRIVQVPCSRVGHLQPKNHHYLTRFGDPHEMGKEVSKNLKRIVEVWIDDPVLKSTIYRYLPLLKNVYEGDLSVPRSKYDKYDSESFQWFITEVMPELRQITPRNRLDFAFGHIKLEGYPDSCLTVNAERKHLTLEPCIANNTHQNWTLTHLNDLRTADNFCLEVHSHVAVRYNYCHNLGGRQSWNYNSYTKQLVSNSLCLESGGRLYFYVGICNTSQRRQRWFFDNLNLDLLASVKTN
ncbi:putative polypeptide N-acetylgalactosaminyltransferase 12 [Drosophila ficusphila]|uniref:putative polypeptide N-acetylgalactosaminyltransferase 12 n=1 Tax=Drosophila ficusphila TaxID=30025 RepID=UPI0007E75E33|nr:putative polypeptide N-acetylgalactosaminyltransferase 12 [Drosophila ficusphila]